MNSTGNPSKLRHLLTLNRILPILFGSLLTSPYGAWTTDMVVLLIPVLTVAADLACDGQKRLILEAVAAWLMIDLAAWISGINRVEEGYFIWFTPVTLVAYVLICRQRKDATP